MIFPPAAARSPVRAFGLAALVAAALAGASPAAVAAGDPPGGAGSGGAGAARRLELGPERIVCGVTAPASSTNKDGKPRLGLVIWFHGGMRSGNREKGLEAHRPLLTWVDSKAFVLASPSAFAGRDWLAPGALATTEMLIDTLLALYPIDPADISLIGVSDGSLAVIRYGAEGRRTIRRKVLVSSLPQLAITQEALPNMRRFAEGRWDFIQGGQDRLFPAGTVVPFLKEWERLFPNARLHYYPEGEHDFGYYAKTASGLLRDLLKSAPLEDKPQKPKKSKPVQNSPKKT